jgi:hypothetical protein
MKKQVVTMPTRYLKEAGRQLAISEKSLTLPSHSYVKLPGATCTITYSTTKTKK